MAKNLKLNIKNTQLAEALNLNQIKKSGAKKKKSLEVSTHDQEREKEAKAQATPQETSKSSPVSSEPPPIEMEQAPAKKMSQPLEESPPHAAVKSTSHTPQEPIREPRIERASTVPEGNKPLDEKKRERNLPSEIKEERPLTPTSEMPAAYKKPLPDRTDYRTSSTEGRPEHKRPHEGRSEYQRPLESRPDYKRSSPEPRPPYKRPYEGRSDYNRPASTGSSEYRRPGTQGRPDYNRPPSTGSSEYRRPGTQGRPDYNRPPSTGSSEYRRPGTQGRPDYNRPPSTGSSEYRRPGTQRRPDYNRPPSTGSSSEYRRPPFQSRPDYKRPDTEGRSEFKRSFPDVKKLPLKETSSIAKRSAKVAKRSEDDHEVKKTGLKDVRDSKPQRKLSPYDRTFDSRDRLGLRADQDDQVWRKKRPAQKMRSAVEEVVVRPKSLSIRIPVAIKDLAAEMKLKASQLLSVLFMKGMVLTLNDYLDDPTTIQILGHDFDCEITIDTSEEDRLRITDKTIKQEIQETASNHLFYRPPVVAFMGHVDHGKTSLIDAIRVSKLAAGEAGAITQHIGAFKCHTQAGDITILDTPGHEAFSAMRARGADVTDIVVLVIAGDEGIRTQTLEAIQQAQTANVPIVVAVTKSDKPNFNTDNVYRQLADQQLLPEAWGGQTIAISCSAVTGDGIQQLLEMLALQAEILELKANPHTRARGTVIESEMHKGLGPVATVLVQNGTLRIGDCVVFSQNYARVKTMYDELSREVTEAAPSTPVKITGLSGLPEAGSEFISVRDEKEARDLAEMRSEGKRYQMMQQPKRATTESFLAEKSSSPVKKILNLILRADVQGSVEALKTSLLKIPSTKIALNIISASVGEISESDVQLAQTSKATIIGFHTQVESHADSLIRELKVKVILHDVIYHVVDDVREIMKNLLDKIAQENEVGTALVKATFKASQLGIIAGCIVSEGLIKRSHQIKVIRNGELVWKGAIASLKRVKEDVREVSKGHECGILLQNFNDVKVDDILQAVEITYLEQEL